MIKLCHKGMTFWNFKDTPRDRLFLQDWTFIRLPKYFHQLGTNNLNKNSYGYNSLTETIFNQYTKILYSEKKLLPNFWKIPNYSFIDITNGNIMVPYIAMIGCPITPTRFLLYQPNVLVLSPSHLSSYYNLICNYRPLKHNYSTLLGDTSEYFVITVNNNN